MHNMLNQFYEYMSNKLVEFLKGQKLEGGERFYLQFDYEQHVKEFYEALRSLPISEEFIYQHEHGTPYETFALNIDGIKVVIAATINGITPDFLVTLRNLASDQEGDWKNTALISISPSVPGQYQRRKQRPSTKRDAVQCKKHYQFHQRRT